MSRRGLVVALLCALLGVGLGALVAYAVQPTSSTAGTAAPISAVSPSVPIDTPTVKPPAPDISYPRLRRDLPLPPPAHTIGNDLATWTYHVPQGWQAYAVCSTLGECTPPMQTDDPLTPRQAARQSEVRYRPPDEPVLGGYSLRVKALDNTLGYNTGQLVGTKIVGFQQQFAKDQFTLLRQTSSAAYFTFRDSTNHLRFNYFQWFAAPDSSVGTLEMSVAGRARDVRGLKALFNRFADNVVGSSTPYHPPAARPKQSQSPSPSVTPSDSGSPSTTPSS